MGKKDKKKKGMGSEKTALKAEKNLNKKLKKSLALQGEEDIDSLLQKFTEDDKKKTAIVEELVPPPSKRTSFSFIPHPDKDQLIMFGGEYFNGNQALVYNDLYFYQIKQDRWLHVESPGGPKPRNSHQMVSLAQAGGQLWLFGGEFTSKSQSQFYHFKDLWVFHLSSKKWEKVTGEGKCPSARSGHRMVALKKQLVIFGGFHDNTRDCKYFNDVHIFDVENYKWQKIEPTGNAPSPRSACQMTVLTNGRILVYGGYSRAKAKKEEEKGVMHTDMFILAPEKHDTTGLKWRWSEVRNKGGAWRPSTRSSATMTTGLDRAYLFGGVFDETDESDDLNGVFYNDLYSLCLENNVWNEVKLTGKKDENLAKKSRRKVNKENLDEEMEMDDESESEAEQEQEQEPKEKVISDDGVFKLTVGPSLASLAASTSSARGGAFLPPPRFSAGMAVKKGILYLYGGMFEDGDKQLALNDFYSLDLSKLEEWTTIIALDKNDLEWFDSESEDDDDDEDEDDDESDEEEEEEEQMK